MLNSSIWLIDRTLSCATTPGESELGINGNKDVFYIPQSSRSEVSPSNGFGHLLKGFTPLHKCSRRILPPKPTGLKME